MTLPSMNPSTFAAPPANDSHLIKPKEVLAAHLDEGEVFAGPSR